MVLGCLASWAVNILFQWDPLSFYLVHILIWFLSDWIMLSVVQVKKSKLHSCLMQIYISEYFRTDLCHSINSTSSLDGCFVNLVDLIYFYVRYLIQQLDGEKGPSNYTGEELLMSWNRGSSHSERNSHFVKRFYEILHSKLFQIHCPKYSFSSP